MSWRFSLILLVIVSMSGCMFRKSAGPVSTERGGRNQSSDQRQRATDGNGNGSALAEAAAKISDTSFFAQLNSADPGTNCWTSAGTICWAAGTFTNTDQDGNSLHGVLIGLLSPTANGGETLQSILVGTSGVGLWTGAVGNGHATINWGDQAFGGVWRGDMYTVPAIQREKGKQ